LGEVRVEVRRVEVRVVVMYLYDVYDPHNDI
jgi:hypothetical protein